MSWRRRRGYAQFSDVSNEPEGDIEMHAPEEDENERGEAEDVKLTSTLAAAIDSGEKAPDEAAPDPPPADSA